jgi:lipid A 3-O-deacylase
MLMVCLSLPARNFAFSPTLEAPLGSVNAGGTRPPIAPRSKRRLVNRAPVPHHRARNSPVWREAHMRRWDLVLAAIVGVAAPPPALAAGFIDEARLGLLDHDIGLFDHHAEHGIDVNGELLFASPGLLGAIGAPHPNLGLTVNTSGNTDYAYFGLAWSGMLWGPLFGELGLGGAVHDGELDPTPGHRKALGSRILFHEELELGYRLSNAFGVSAFLDHISNANLAHHNQGLSNLGMRGAFFF